MFKEFKKWFMKDPGTYTGKTSYIPDGYEWTTDVIKSSKSINFKEAPKYKCILLWVGPSGEKLFESIYSTGTVIPSVGSTVVISKYSGLVTKVHINYNVDTKNGDHVAAKITMRCF